MKYGKLLTMSSSGQSLVVAPQWLGDAVMTEPLLRRLAARGEQLTVAALPAVAPIYRAMPCVGEVLEWTFARGRIELQARRAVARSIRGRFHTAYVLPNSFKSALIPFFAGIPCRIGYVGEARWGVLTQRLPNPPDDVRPPMVAFYGALSGQTGVEQDRPQLQLDAAQAQPAGNLAQLPPQGYFALAPGAEYGPAKRWPAQHFAQLAQLLDMPVVLLGSPKEVDLCQDIALAANAHHAGTCLNLAGKTSVAQALALVANARGLVSNDSGLMHVGAALGVPQVAVFGSSSPLHTPPLNPNARVVWLKNDAAYQPALDCAPCFERTCPLDHTRCLNDVTAQQVAELLALAVQTEERALL